MTILESEVAGLRRKAALAVKEDHRHAEACALRASRSRGSEYVALAAVLRALGTERAPAKITQRGARSERTVFDPGLFVAALQREAHGRTLAEAREERERLTRARAFASSVVEDHLKLAEEWVSGMSQWDTELGAELIRLEHEECGLLTRLARLEEAQILSCDAEQALGRLLTIFHGAVDHVVPAGAPDGESRAVLRPERLASVDAAIFDAQATLTATRRALGGTPYLDDGVFQVELLSGFAGMCIASLGRDFEERDGTGRAARSVSWTLATVRALRGYVARSEFEEKHALDELRIRRTRLLSKTRS